MSNEHTTRVIEAANVAGLFSVDSDGRPFQIGSRQYAITKRLPGGRLVGASVNVKAEHLSCWTRKAVVVSIVDSMPLVPEGLTWFPLFDTADVAVAWAEENETGRIEA